MNTITINTSKSYAAHWWIAKEYGSWEDHDKDPKHRCAVLQQFGKRITITVEQAKELINSGQYFASFDDDDIDYDSARNARRIRKTIQRYVSLLKKELKQIGEPIPTGFDN